MTREPITHADIAFVLREFPETHARVLDDSAPEVVWSTLEDELDAWLYGVQADHEADPDQGAPWCDGEYREGMVAGLAAYRAAEQLLTEVYGQRELRPVEPIVYDEAPF